MKKLRFLGMLATTVLLVLAFIACDSGSGTGKAGTGDDGITDDRPIESYTGTKNSVTYTLVTGPAKAKAVHLPGDFYTLTAKKSAEEKESAGTVVDFTENVFTLQPSYKDAPTFTVTISGEKITNISGTITYTDGSTETGPGAFTTSGGSRGGSSSGNNTGTTTATSTAPTITTASLPGGVVGTAYSQTLTASGTTPITWSIDSGSLPTGLTLSGAVISGTPAATGTSTFTVKATNSAGNVTKSLSIDITAAPVAPTISTASLPGGEVGTAYSQTLAATGTAPITWSISVGSLPAPLTINATTGVISGTPTAAGTSTFTVQATNGVGSDTKSLSITIAAAAGTPDTSWYSTGSSTFTLAGADEVAGLAQLVNAGNNFSTKTITLSGNLDLSAYTDWTPIGTDTNWFSGTFDGSGKIISNLTITGSLDNRGLFGYIRDGGVVKNLMLEDVDINSTGTKIGGVVGWNQGTVSNCSSEGSVKGNEQVGGVVGRNDTVGTVENCYSTGSVTGSASAGGVVGATLGTVKNCYSTGSVTSSGSAGGVVGSSASGGNIVNCYSTGVVIGVIYVGGVAGSGSSSSTVENCLALNPSITRNTGLQTYFGRVVGSNSFSLTNNYAWEDMKFYVGATVQPDFPTAVVSDPDDINGADLSAAAAKAAATNWPTPFQSLPWVWNGATGLPSLSGVGTVQSWPGHL